MISGGKVRKILGELAKKFTAEQLAAIRAYLAQLAQYNVEIINIQKEKENEERK